MHRTAKITGLSLLVLGQVALFALVYLATIGVGLGLVYLALRASMWFVPWFIGNLAPALLGAGMLGVALIIMIAIPFVGMWAFVGTVAVYLIKPLFLFPKRTRDFGVEMKREDSPKLHDLIMKTAEEAGVRKPRHIYVNNEVNACVFFDTGFWNLFLPSRKNLVVGLGLFESMSSEEVKGIIAHEFGHFAQGSMRVGPVLYRANQVITALAYRRDGLDRMMLHWCLEDGFWGFCGRGAQLVVIRFRSLVDFMFRSQQRNHMKLSRQMEYDADAVACRIVGTETFVSALCKTGRLNKSFGFYNQLLNDMAGEQKTVADYWQGYELARPTMEAGGYLPSSFDTVERTPESEGAPSRVTMEEAWESHPSYGNRVKQARELGLAEDSPKPKIPAWDLVGDELKARASHDVLQKFRELRNITSTIDWAEYSEKLDKVREASFFPKEVDVFFDRQIVIDPEAGADDNHPLAEANRTLVTEYEQALRDKQLLSMVVEGKTPAKRITYDGTSYSLSDVPFGKHDRYVDGLKAKVASIDASIRKLAESKAGDGGMIGAAYDAIAYAQSICSAIQADFLPARADITKELNEAKIACHDDYEVLRGWLDSYETALRELLKSLKHQQIHPFMTQEQHDYILDYMEGRRSFNAGIDSRAVDHVFAITDWISDIHNNLAKRAKMYVVAVLLGKDLPDIGFLRLWGKSLELRPQSEEVKPAWSYGRGHVVLESAYGKLDLIVPTDAELETVGHRELFRRRLWKKYDELEEGQPFGYPMVASVPLKDEDGYLSCLNPEDQGRFMDENVEFFRFINTFNETLDWDKISESADNGDAYDCSRMASLYLSRGQRNMAFGAAMKAALGGESSGLVTLGILEETGEEKHSERAVQLFKCAAAQGNVYGLYNLGSRYDTGDGVQRDEAKALRFFERAALQGNTEAQNRVGLMYLTGKGTPADPEKGLAWLRSAAKHGHHEAINTIWKYHKSAGDRPRYIEALQWGAREGLPECKRELEVLMGCHIFSDPGE